MLLITYVVLVVASNVWVWRRPQSALPPAASTPAGASRFDTPVSISIAGNRGLGVTLSALRWPAGEPGNKAAPVILIHGGPGQARDFAGMRATADDPGLAAILARDRDVYAIDLLGFGDSTRDVPDYSMLANARAVLEWMRGNNIAKAHVLGWSQGGGVVLHMADLEPDRVASVTLAAAVAMQQTEGSRSYAFEHVRYAVGDAARVALPRITPHFGMMPPAPPAFTRFFSDSDQRPMRDVLGRLKPPLLVLHGRKDFLIPHWAAVEHARAAPRDRAMVIMTPWSHFVPFWSIDKRAQAAGWLSDFWAAADGSVEPDIPASVHDIAATTPSGSAHAAGSDFVFEAEGAAVPRLFGSFGAKRAELIVLMPWWGIASMIALLAARRTNTPRWSIAAAAMLVVCGLVDYGVAWVGLAAGGWIALGRAVRAESQTPSDRVRAEWHERSRRGALWCGAMALLRPDLRREIGEGARSLTGARRAAFVAAAAATVVIHRLILLVVALVAISVIVWDPFHPLREWGVLLALVVARIAIGVVDHLLTIPGRRELRAAWTRALRFEFWPTWLVCLCLGPMFVRQTMRTRHPLAFTACNPGIEKGGGVIGESKYVIMQAWHEGARESGIDVRLAGAVCRTWLLPPGELDARLARLDVLLNDAANELRYPIVLKPEAGHRGFAVRVVRSREDARRAFEMVPTPLLVQPWHPGPGEVGVVWARRTDGEGAGAIFSITLKQFSFLEGDGRRAIEELIWRHPRYRLQAATLLTRLKGDRLRVLAGGERLPLALAGNHCQGTLFRDGAHLITPELEAAVHALVGSYRGATGKGASSRSDELAPLDMVRLDIRYRDEGDLRAGRLDADSIVEMNGTLGESTNIYDPDRPVSWSLGVLRQQWEFLYTRGGERMREGHRPMTIMTMFRSLWQHYSTRRGSSVAD